MATNQCEMVRPIFAINNRTGETIAAAQVRCCNASSRFITLTDNSDGSNVMVDTCYDCFSKYYYNVPD